MALIFHKANHLIFCKISIKIVKNKYRRSWPILKSRRKFNLLAQQNEENFPLSETVEKKSLEILLPAMETENADFLTQDVQVWQENADWMYERGILDKKVDTSDMVVDLLK